MGLLYKVTKLTNEKGLDATLWQPSLVDFFEGFDYKSRTGGVG